MRIQLKAALLCALFAPAAVLAQSLESDNADQQSKGLASPEFSVAGAARITGDVVVQGTLLVGGGTDLGLFYVEQTGGEVSFLEAECPSGSRVISGGCRSSDSSSALSTSYPEGINNWICSWDSTAGNKSAIVLCAPR